MSRVTFPRSHLSIWRFEGAVLRIFPIFHYDGSGWKLDLHRHSQYSFLQGTDLALLPLALIAFDE